MIERIVAEVSGGPDWLSVSTSRAFRLEVFLDDGRCWSAVHPFPDGEGDRLMANMVSGELSRAVGVLEKEKGEK